MSRLMSVAFTEQAVVERRKTVTRRKGWWENKHGKRLLIPGDRLTLCRKVMGRKAGEPLVRLAEVEVVSVRREPLCALQMDLTYGQHEMEREGFPGMDPLGFIDRYFIAAQGMTELDEVTRIEWRYLYEGTCDSCGRTSPDSALCPSCAVEWERLRAEYRDERADWWR